MVVLKRANNGAGRGLAKQLLHWVFTVCQRLGFDVLPRHFYSAIPNIRQLSADDSWRVSSEMVGVRGTDLDGQAAELQQWFTPDVLAELGRDDVYARAVAANGAVGFGPAEAQILHAFVASQRPRRVIQVGAGVSTAVILHAAERHGTGTRTICVDPFPTDYLVRLDGESSIDLIAEPAQVVPMEVFTQLEAGDLLFIDSTHTVKPGSEVNRLILEVLPRLATGVVVHFHDISFPYDYQRDVIERALFFWMESTLLHAFLIGNSRARILVSGSMLQYGRVEAMQKLLPRFDPRAHDRGLDIDHDLRDFAGSTYLLIDGD